MGKRTIVSNEELAEWRQFREQDCLGEINSDKRDFITVVGYFNAHAREKFDIPEFAQVFREEFLNSLTFQENSQNPNPDQFVAEATMCADYVCSLLIDMFGFNYLSLVEQVFSEKGLFADVPLIQAMPGLRRRAGIHFLVATLFSVFETV